MIHVIRDSPVVVAITLDELLLAGQIPIELRYILFSSFLKRWKQELSSIGLYIEIVVDQAIFIY